MVRQAAACALALGALATVTAPAAAATQDLLVLGRGGRVHVRRAPNAYASMASLPVPVAAAATTRRHTASGPTFTRALQMLLASGGIDQTTYNSGIVAWSRAHRSLGRLSGTRAVEFGAVISNLQQIAAAGELTPSRLPALMLTLDRNRQWWTTGPLLSDGQRTSFSGSRIVWEYYPGQGIEIQWLGTFGEANGYWQSGHHDSDLAALLDEVVPLATKRAGGIAWEYEFNFGGGSPPWVSGMAQGTAIQSLARAAVRLKRPDYDAVAHSALGIFQRPPPQGVRVATAAGAHYLLYSFASDQRVLNGFIQAVVGLYDYATLGADPAAMALFESGDAEARVEVPNYDTGAWSLYDTSTESSLSYHLLLRDFLSHLCQRTVPPPTGGGAPAQPPADEIFCTTAQNFTDYLKQPPVLTLVAPGVIHARASARLRFTLSKVSYVTLTLHRGGHVFQLVGEQLAHGHHGFDWMPASAGTYELAATAYDLAGNSAQSSEQVTVRAPRHG